MRRGGTEVTAERLQNTIGLRCEGTTPERGWDAGEREREEGEKEREREREREREGERERKKETYLIYSYHCRTWHFVAFCFVFNKHIYTFPSHWTWLKGWLEFVSTQLSLSHRPEHTPLFKYTCICQNHTHTHTCWLNLMHSFAQVQACQVIPCLMCTHAHPVISWEQPGTCGYTQSHIITSAHCCMHTWFKHTNQLSCKYKCRCALTVVYTYTQIHTVAF